MKVILQVNGKKRIFSKQELTALVEEYFSTNVQETHEVAQTPSEGKWFEVNPESINQELFQQKRKDYQQEYTRNLILEAFSEANKNPEKYAKPFQTMIPKMSCNNSRSVAELKERASKIGDHLADWVEQALEWAQRIQNGETWRDICNNSDTANWFRLIVWKNGHYRLVGGSKVHERVKPSPASDVQNTDLDIYFLIYNTVPLIVR